MASHELDYCKTPPPPTTLDKLSITSSERKCHSFTAQGSCPVASSNNNPTAGPATSSTQTLSPTFRRRFLLPQPLDQDPLQSPGSRIFPHISSVMSFFSLQVAHSPHFGGAAGDDERRSLLSHSYTGEFADHQDMSGAFFTLSKTIVGSGILGLPFVLAASGLIPFILLVAVFAAMNAYTMLLLVWGTEVATLGFPGVGHFGWTFTEMGTCAYGNRGRLAVLIVNGFDLWGTLVAYLVVIADVVTPVSQLLKTNSASCHSSGSASATSSLWCSALDVTSQRSMVIILTAALVLPLCSLRQIKSLACSSMLGMAAIVTFVLYVSFQSLSTQFFHHWGEARWWPDTWDGVLSGMPVIAFAFSAQFNIFSIYSSLYQRSPARMAVVTHGSVWASAAVYGVLAMLGYLLFIDRTIQGNILSNFPVRSIGFNVVRALFGLSVFLTIPTICFEVRSMCTRLFVPDDEARFQHLVIVAAGLMGTAAVVAVAVPDLAFVFGVMGSTTTAMMSFVFPPAFYLKVHKATTSIYGVSLESEFPSRIGAWAMLILGVLSVPLFTFFTVYYS